MPELVRHIPIPQSLVLMLIGHEGSGKTTLANTAESVLHIGFDERSLSRAKTFTMPDSLVVKKWADFTGLWLTDEGKAILKAHRTVVIDTAGRMSDYAEEDIIQQGGTAKMVEGDELGRGGWGVLATKLKKAVHAIIAQGPDVILLCHIKVGGDKKRDEPAIQGSAMGYFKGLVDALGWFKKTGDKYLLDFTDSQDFAGKCGTGFKQVKYEVTRDDQNWMATFIADRKAERTATLTETNLRACSDRGVIEEWKGKLANATDADEFNMLAPEFSAACKKMVEPGQSLLLAAITERRIALGLRLNKEARVYELEA